MQQFNYELLVKQEDNRYAGQKRIIVVASNSSEAKKQAENMGYRVYSCVSKGRA